MGIWAGIDIAKEVHWATAVDDRGQVVLDRRVGNDPAQLAELAEQLGGLDGELVVGLDVVGGIASLAEAVLSQAGVRLVHVPGLAVNRARLATRGGQNKSDPRDARVIAEQVRTRNDLRPLRPQGELLVQLRLVTGRRRDLVGEQTRRLARLHDLLVCVHPGLERVLDLTTKSGLWLLCRYVTPAEVRAAGPSGLEDHLAGGGLARPQRQRLVAQAVAAAAAQQLSITGEQLAAGLVRELAGEALACRARLAELDGDLARLLAQHPDAALIQSLPGMGTILTRSSSPTPATWPASARPTSWPPRPGWPRYCTSRASSGSSAAQPGAARTSSGSSTSRRSARCARPTAAPSTPANAAKASATIRP
jgi:hypothetical protein